MQDVTNLYMKEIFKQECEEAGIPFDSFPFDFSEGSPMNLGYIVKAVIWILKKRQDKMMNPNFIIPEDFENA